MGQPNIAELAVAAWRLERWLDNLNAERKMAAKKSLREIRKYLDESDIEIVDPLGWRFDPGLAVEVINNEAEDVAEEELIIIQTNSPIIKQGGSVIQYGKIILGQAIKEQKPNNEVKSEAPIESGVPAENASQERTDVLKQSRLIATETYWIKSFDCKATKEGYQAIIEVDSNVEAEVLLMDEQVYADYCKGIPPRSPFRYVAKPGSAYIPLPYPDIWFMLAYPTSGKIGAGYAFDMNCNWAKKSDLVKPATGNDVADEKSNASSDESADDISDEPISVDTAPSDTATEVQQTGESAAGEVKVETTKEDVPDMTEKELERLKKKNITSFNLHRAMDKGLISQIHGKKKK